MQWYQVKVFIAHATGFSMDALHVMVGVIIQLVLASFVRRRLASFIPWLAALAIELANEISDVWTEPWPDVPMQYGEAAKDVLMTMILPTLLLVLARCAPRRLIGVPASDPVVAAVPVDEAGDPDVDAGGRREA